MQIHIAVNRSMLYVPGDRPDRVVKALRSAADAVIIDLEDAVKPENKPVARDTVRTLSTINVAPLVDVWVRINAGDEGRRDLAALADVEGIAGLVLAKCETGEWVGEVAGATPPTWLLSPLIETARAVRDVDEIVAAARVGACHLGEVDLLADLHGSPPAGARLIDAARVSLVLACAAGGVEPPIGGVHLQIDDTVSLAASSAELAQLGFAGRAVVHPSHCAVVNEMFSPSDDELARAAELLARYAAAADGAVRGSDGSMIDEAVVRRARWVMSRRR